MDNNFNILVVDDEPDVFIVTKLVLNNKKHEGVIIKVINSCSSKEAIEILTERDDIGLILLDIVMESDSAGYNVIDFVRNKKNDNESHIVIRTGFPGRVPTEFIKLIEGINGYVEKGNCTDFKLKEIAFSAIDTIINH